MTFADTDAVTALADETMTALLDAEPLLEIMLGLHERSGHLGDPSRPAQERHEARLAELAGRLRALPADTARDVVLHIVEADLERSRLAMPEFTVADKFDSPVNDLITVLPESTIGDATQAAAYLDRLRAIPAYLTGITDRQVTATAAGRTGVARLIEAAAAQVAALPAAGAGHPLARPEPPAGWDGAAAWADERAAIITDTLRPAFLRYAEVLRADLLPAGRDDEHPGVCWLPDGEAIYAGALRQHTTTDMTAAEVHQLGVDCMAALHEEFAAIGGRVYGTADVPEIFRRLRTDPELRYRDAQHILDLAAATIARAEEAAPQWFGRRPEARCRVRPVPAESAANLPGAYYLGPSLDGSRPGTYFANTHDAPDRLRHEAESTAFHEAVPGHHFQISLALELTDLPLLRRFYPFTAYDEGWGLYAERLAEEMGLYSDDIARLGMLAGDAMRAARLVVDTGLHAQGWSRQRALDYFAESTPLAAAVYTTEVDRYVASPGQAVAYMVGRTAIQRIRAAAEQRLGDRFDIRAFHDVVLGSGAVPLDVLESMVTRWADSLCS